MEPERSFDGAFNPNSESHVERTSWLLWRYFIVLLSFFGLAYAFATRVSLSLAVVVMRDNRTVILPNETKIIQGSEFDWGSGVEGVILSSFFYGYILTQLTGGCLADAYGGKNVFGIGVGVMGVVTLITPLLARSSVYLLIFARVLEGFCQGAVFPAIVVLWSKWSPPKEGKCLIAVSYTGCYFGTVAALPLCGALAERFGWPSIFYVFGTFGCIWAVLWMSMISESPSFDKHISVSENDYVEDSLDSAASKVVKEIYVPWKEIFSSRPVWAIFIANFSERWGFYTFLTELPSYLDDVFRYNFLSTGLLAALPFLAMGIVVQTSSYLADWFRSSGHLTTIQVRKLFTCTGFVTRAIFLIAAAHSSTPFALVTCITIAVGFGGASFAGFRVNHLDIAPQYCGILMIISNTLATLPGILCPMLTGYTVKNRTPEEWRITLYFVAVIHCFGSIIYAAHATDKIQSWDLVKQEEVFLSESEQSQSSTEDLTPVPIHR